MPTPEIIGLNQLPVVEGAVPAGTLLVAVVDGQDKLIDAAGIGIAPPTLEELGLDHVDNTPDADKPVSTAQAARFEVIESALASIDPDTGFDGTNIIGRTEFSAYKDQVAAEFENLPGNVDLSAYATTAAVDTKLADYTKTADLPAPVDTSAFATTEAVTAAIGAATEGLATAQSVTDLATQTSQALTQVHDQIPDVSGLVTSQQLTEAINGVSAPDLSGYATTEALQTVQQSIPSVDGLVTSQQLTDAINGVQAPDLSGYATTQALEAVQQSIPSTEGLVTGDALTTALQPYAKTADIPTAPDLTGYATTAAVDTALADYTKTADLPAAPDLSTYATNDSLSQAIEAVQQTIPSTEGLASTSYVNDAVAPLATSASVTEALADYTKTADLPSAPDLSSYATTSAMTDAINQLVLDLKTGRLVWVDGSTTAGDGERTGSIGRPFKTIQEAIDAQGNNTVGVVIMVVPAQTGSNYAGFTVNNLLNLQVQGFGCVDAQAVRIDGTVTVTGAQTTRFRMRDISIFPTDPTQPGLELSTPLNRHYFENVTVEPTSGQSVPIVQIKGDNTNWIDFNNCNIDGEIHMEASTHNAQITMRHGNNDTTKITSEGGWKIVIQSATRFGSINAPDDYVEVTNTTEWTGNAGVAIAHASDTKALVLHGNNFQKANGTYTSIQKTGASPYQLSDQNLDPTICTFTGTNQSYQKPAPQILPTFSLDEVTGNANNVSGNINFNLHGYSPTGLRFLVESSPDGETWEALGDYIFNASNSTIPFSYTASNPASFARLTVSDNFNPTLDPIVQTAPVSPAPG